MMFVRQDEIFHGRVWKGVSVLDRRLLLAKYIFEGHESCALLMYQRKPSLWTGGFLTIIISLGRQSDCCQQDD